MSAFTTTSTGKRVEQVIYWTLLAATALNCIFQSVWFWPLTFHRVGLDGINYIGLARHMTDGDYRLSIHGYWSPLVTWFIAGASLFAKNFDVAGKVVTLGSFLICLPLLYVLTLHLWHSPTASALSVFWFSTSRSVIAIAAGLVLADFLLTACVLGYFTLLLKALRNDRPLIWLALGGMHALAFLAKAIAIQWLWIPTLLALLVRYFREPRRLAASLALASLLPALTCVGWGIALRTKYGAFTTGYQLRRNLMVNWNRTLSGYPHGNPFPYHDTSSDYDKYMVGEYPFSELQSFRLRNPKLLLMLLGTEIHNLPVAIKETAILLTPAGSLGVIAMLVLLIRRRREFPFETEFVCIALVSAAALVAAYCMLVFDGRYVIPLIPLLIAISCPLLLPSDMAGVSPSLAPRMGRALIGLFAASVIFFSVYWASPFRREDRDFTFGCFQGASLLRSKSPAGTLVSLGEGPYPEHGVGPEAGIYLAYFAGWRVIGENLALPDSLAEADNLVDQAFTSGSDAIAIWGTERNPTYSYMLAKVQAAGSSSTTKLIDPYKGEVGALIILR